MMQLLTSFRVVEKFPTEVMRYFDKYIIELYSMESWRQISVIICVSVEYPTNIQFPVTSSAKYSRSIPGVSFDFLRLSGKLGSF